MKISIQQTILRCAFGLGLSVACATSLQAQSAGTSGGSDGGVSGGSQGTSTTSGSGTGTSAGRTGGSTNSPGSTSGTPPASSARPAQGTSTANDGLGTSTTNRTGSTNATGTSATGTNNTGSSTGTNGFNTNSNASRTSGLSPNTFGPNGVANGTTSGTSTTGTNNNAGTNTTGNNNVGATNGTAAMSSMAGNISAFAGTDFTLSGVGTNGAPGTFQFTPDTLFTDTSGNAVPRDRFFRRGSQTPATVFYNRDANGNMIASRVVLNESATAEAPIEQAGTITEVSPGILVVEQPGASNTPVRFVNNTTTNYVNEAGQPVAPESVKAGTPVRIFYTKVGDTLVASRVEVHQGNKSVLPAPPIGGSDTTTIQKVK